MFQCLSSFRIFTTPTTTQEFISAETSQFGSGWVWLLKDDARCVLRILKTEIGVNSLGFGLRTLLGCGVWEHSYYVYFRNKRQPTSIFFTTGWSTGKPSPHGCESTQRQQPQSRSSTASVREGRAVFIHLQSLGTHG